MYVYLFQINNITKFHGCKSDGHVKDTLAAVSGKAYQDPTPKDTCPSSGIDLVTNIMDYIFE